MTNYDLEAAVKLHEQGRLDEAARVYMREIGANPILAVAWNLLGVVAYQKGEHARAVELIHHAIHIDPNEAAFHLNIAEAYRALSQFEQAAASSQSALRIDPQLAAASNNLGLALMGMGRTNEAIRQFETAIDQQAGFARAHNNLGTALRQTGRLDEALEQFRKAVRLDGQSAEAHSNLGQLLLERYQRQESLAHCQEAARLQPHFPEAQNNLGNVLRELGRLEDAQACYCEALRLNPGLALTCNNMGQVLQEQGLLDGALAWYRRALRMDSNSAVIHCNMGSLLQEMEQDSSADEHYERALQLDPHLAASHHGRGWILQERGELEAAMSCYREALRPRPGFAITLCNMGTVLQELGDLEQAERSFRESLRCDPDYVVAHAQLATLLRGKLSAPELLTIGRLIDNPGLPQHKRATLQFGLAHVSDAQRNFAPAAELLRHANSNTLAERTRRNQQYDAAQHAQFVAGIIETFTPACFERMKGFGLTSERPVFIVGLPRSGTTLTEQILASHSQIFGAGELGLAGSIFTSLPQAMSSELTAWECVNRLDPLQTREIAQQYLDRLAKIDAAALRVVDKMPDNYLYLGLIAILFPHAKIIHCRRDLRDIAVSCWMTNFRQIRWANDFQSIASRFHAYRQLMNHWSDVLPVSVLEIDYEETVADIEGTARRMVDWCGLDWEPSCAAFHEHRGKVRTASVTQVRQPVYRTSVERWRNYEPHLAELFALLPE